MSQGGPKVDPDPNARLPLKELQMIDQQARAARRELARITRQYENQQPIRKSDGSVRHKCFISYHSADAEEVLKFVEDFDSAFIPRSVGLSDEDGPLIESDDAAYVANTIRDKFLRDSTVTIVMIGRCTWSRRFVDGEVYSSLRRGKLNRLNGLMAIELPSVSGNSKLQARVADNYVKDGDSYARYWVYPESVSQLQRWIQTAYDARDSKDHLIDNTRLRRKASASCP
jgi:hypothetical protein